MDWSWLLGVIGAVAAIWVALLAILWVFRPRDTSLGELLRLIPDVLRLIRALLADRSTPLGVRLALGALLIWIVSPIDLIPEFIPVLGPLDDVVVAVLVLRWVSRRLGPEELARRWPGKPEGFALLRRVLD